MRTVSQYYCENCNYKHNSKFSIGYCNICSKEICDVCCAENENGNMCCSNSDCLEGYGGGQ